MWVYKSQCYKNIITSKFDIIKVDVVKSTFWLKTEKALLEVFKIDAIAQSVCDDNIPWIGFILFAHSNWGHGFRGDGSSSWLRGPGFDSNERQTFAVFTPILDGYSRITSQVARRRGLLICHDWFIQLLFVLNRLENTIVQCKQNTKQSIGRQLFFPQKLCDKSLAIFY